MKLNTTLKSISLAAVLMAGFSSCKKDKMPDIVPGPISTLGVYVLNEGAYNWATSTANSSISYYDIATKTLEKDYFKKQNGIDLGLNANDLKQYGSKMYCLVTGTTVAAKDSYIEVLSLATGKSIKRIAFSDATGGFMPRFIVFNKNKAYVSGYDGNITKIDTASLAIDARVKVGGALEELAIVNNKLYVTNSVHPFFPSDIKSSVSVVDLNTFTKIKDIPVGLNPARISATDNGDLFVMTKGQYDPFIAGTIDKLSSVTDTKVSSDDKSGAAFLKITQNKGFAIGYNPGVYLKAVDVSTGALKGDLITDGTIVASPYAVTLNPLDNTFFVADAKDYTNDGMFFAFSAAGKNLFSFATGVNPQGAAFRYGYK